MAAKRTVRTVATFLVVLSVVASVLVAPVGATGDDDTLSTDDDDGVSVGTNDTTVSVDDSGVTAESGDSGVTVGADGVDTDDGSAGDSSASPGADEAGAAASGPLPVNYSDIPWDSLPADVCSPPVDPTNPPSSPVNPEEPPEQWPDNQSWPVPDTVVNPNDPPGAPFGYCEIFDPTSPPFDPTDPPRNPGYSTDTEQSNPQRYIMSGEVTLDQDGEGPGVSLVTGGFTRQDRVANAQRVTVNDGQKNYVLHTGVDHNPGTRKGEVVAKPTVAGRSVTLSVVCDDGNCTVAAGGTPAPSQRIPVGGGSNESDSSSSSDAGDADGGNAGSGDSGAGDAGGATDGTRSAADSADADHSTDVGADGSTARATAGTDDAAVFADVRVAGLGTGIPDAASATGALLDQL